MNASRVMAGIVGSLLIVVGAGAARGAAPSVELDLAGEWTLSGTDEAGAPLTCPIAVPGDVQSGLLAAGLIPDPFWGRNEKKVQWVGRHDWTVSRTFEAGDELLSKKAIVLRLDRVDTFATISLNGHELGKTDNQFRRWEYDVKPFLKKGRNELKAVFESPERKTVELNAKSPRSYAGSHGGLLSGLVRKTAGHAGWDFTLTLMLEGLCGETRLLAYDDCKVDYVYADQAFNADFTHCDLTVFAEATGADGNAFTVTNRFSIDNPPLWWPNGAGEQRFYEYEIKVGSHVIRRKIGLRKVEVHCPPANGSFGQNGNGIVFRVNGRDLFMRGSNWVPCSALVNPQTPERYRDLIDSAKALNMNMIRINGVGQYEPEVFYEACDANGILIWHDFMFCGSAYPSTDPAFAANIEAEMRHQIKRLRDYACIALWSADNECLWQLRRYPDELEFREREHVARMELQKRLIAECDPARLFWPGSPSKSPDDFYHREFSYGWNHDDWGDQHNWWVWHGRRDFEDYRNWHPRFCSEFGFVSFPSREIAETFLAPDEVRLDNESFNWHQKCAGRFGTTELLVPKIRAYFDEPKDTDGALFQSQAAQALALRTGVEFWRTLRPHCMGALYWQFNDTWPASSFGSIEYGGKWKQSACQARRFLAPVMVVGVPGKVVALNDTAEALPADVTVERWTFDGRILGTKTVRGTVPADGVKAWGAAEAVPAGDDRTSFLVLTMKTPSGVVVNDFVPGRYRNVLAPAHVEAKVDGLKVTLSTDKPAFFVYANARGIRGEFSDNSFTLLPGRPVTVTFNPKEPVTAERFRRAFSVTHLQETCVSGPDDISEFLKLNKDGSALWQIGVKDGRGAELALGTGKYAGYPAFRNAQADPVFRVGKSDDRTDFPYVLPGPLDAWAKGCARAGDTAAVIRFDLAEKGEPGLWRLILDFAEAHSSAPPVVKVEVNGKATMIALPNGGSGRAISSKSSDGAKPYTVQIAVPDGDLRKGANEVRIQAVEGSWAVIDDIRLRAPSGAKLADR